MRLVNYPAQATELRGIAFLIQAIIFRIAPTALEISLVCGILVRIKWCLLRSFPPSAHFIDIQVWLGFCSHNDPSNGCIHVVYCENHGMEVSRLE